MNMDTLDALSPVDGRYWKDTEGLSKYFSEFALIRYRLKIEIEYFIALSSLGIFPSIATNEQKKLRGFYHAFKLGDARDIKKIEQTTKHDVKAVEYYLKGKLKTSAQKKHLEFIHLGLTSEDINNLSYALMLNDCIKELLLPKLMELENKLRSLAKENINLVMLSRTHGQPASPTTLGKEMAIYVTRLSSQFSNLRSIAIKGKLNSASGNYNAHVVAYPEIDWISFSERFIKNLGLESNLITYQIEPHDFLAEIFHCFVRINTILINLDQDIWTYISQEYLMQRPVKGEIGSSTMPHKVNPIDFENSEGNLGIAIALFSHFSEKLPITRLQRDLSDSTVLRNLGVAFAHSVLGITSLLKGLEKIEPNKEKISKDLNNHAEVIAEGIQTILRRERIEMPF